MVPDFSKPAFGFVALCILHCRAIEEGEAPDGLQGYGLGP